MLGHACKQCRFQSYDTSTVNAVPFHKIPFTCQCENEKKKKKKGLKDFNFFSKWYRGSEGVNKQVI